MTSTTDTTTRTPPHLVVGFDASPEAHCALRWAARLATDLGATIEVVDSWTTAGWIGIPPPPPRAELQRRIDSALEGIFGTDRPESVTTSVLEGPAAAALVAASEHASLVIVGSRGHGPATGWLLGSVSAQVAEYSRCPVLVVHRDPPEEALLGRIIVGVDGSEGSRKALRWAAALAAPYRAHIDALNAWQYPLVYGAAGMPLYTYPGPEAEKGLTATVDETFGASRPAGLEMHVLEGDAANVLLDVGQNADLVVVGSRGHGGFAGLLLGSVSARVAERASCAVLVTHGGAPDAWPSALVTQD